VSAALTRDAARDALRAMLRSGAPAEPPGVDRSTLLALVDELHDDALAALAGRGVPDEVAAESLADIPRKASLYGDLVDDGWLLRVFTGGVLALGRLQFERLTGEHGRSIHIPETGPLTPEAVDASLARARSFFSDGSPFVCESWVFDPALGELPATGNLRSFVSRFDVEPAPRTAAGARSLAKFVFRSTPERALAAPLRDGASRVERIAYAALADGRGWSEPFALLRAS
jgi:hypothetical protein